MDEKEKNVIEEKIDEKNPLIIPFAIIFAGVIISAAVIFAFSNRQSLAGENNQSGQQQNPGPTASVSSINNIVPVSSLDHIRGNPDAPIKIVEFSDLECPFCKQFQPTMEQVLATYGNKVAWVYRHYPIDQLHPKARHEAVASECAAEQGGNDMFWKYVDGVFKITPSNNQLDPNQLDVIARGLGLDMQKFDSCLSGTGYDQKISSQIQDAIKSGARGTPYSVVIADNKPVASIDGAYGFASVKQTIDSVLAQ